MNPIVLVLADGNAFFLGTFMAAFPLAAGWVTKRFLMPAILRVVGLIGVALVAASSTPFPSWVYCLWGILWLGGLLTRAKKAKRVVVLCFALVSALLCARELPYRVTPEISVGRNQHVYVIGDSLSAGMGTTERNWPLVLGDKSHLAVTNLAQAGATASTALAQVNGIVIPNSVVLIEIGGNDMLGTTRADRFAEDLDQLLNAIPASCHCVMFELPLLPFNNGYSRAQRELARKHNAILIPKKCLTSVIGVSENTLDGLHLSQKGHDELARLVNGMLRIAG